MLSLCYHALSADWPAPGAVSPEAFERQLRHALGKGYRPLTFSEALAAPRSHKALAVTFDDAFSSAAEIGLPIMARLGVPGTLFVPTDFPDSGRRLAWASLAKWLRTPYEEELRCLPWAQIRGLSATGWEIGSHTCSHPHLTELYDSEVLRELEVSREVCEAQLGRPCEGLAYPYGEWDWRIAQLAQRAGYRWAVGLNEGLMSSSNGVSMLGLPRDGVYRSTSWIHFQVLTSGVARRIRAIFFRGKIAPKP